jgi:deoxyhypusine synthase
LNRGSIFWSNASCSAAVSQLLQLINQCTNSVFWFFVFLSEVCSFKILSLAFFGMRGLLKVVDLDWNPRKSDWFLAAQKTGFQATHIGQAVETIEEMKRQGATVFLSFTGNLVATGLRGIFRDLCKKRFVDAIITTAGAVDHDINRSFTDYFVGSFQMNDAELHKKGLNRVGNILAPTQSFVVLEKKTQQWYQQMLAEKPVWGMSEAIDFFGKNLNKDSFLYWAHKNRIPIFCPGFVDGAIGLQLFFFKQNHKEFIIDAGQDLLELSKIVLNAEKTGAIILGGGIAKHHTLGANLLREGLDFAVYVCTAFEWDGSLSGAQTHEAKSWGKINEKARHVNVAVDATVAFPLIMNQVKPGK